MNGQPEMFTVYGGRITLFNRYLVTIIIDVPWDVRMDPTDEQKTYAKNKTMGLIRYLMREGYLEDPNQTFVQVTSLCQTKL